LTFLLREENHQDTETEVRIDLCKENQTFSYAKVRLYSMDATALLPALAGLRPLPGEAPIAAPPGPLQDAAAIRR